jgi:hypothetical protein
MMAEAFKTVQGDRFPSALVYSSDEYQAIDGEGKVDYPPARFLDEVGVLQCLGYSITSLVR